MRHAVISLHPVSSRSAGHFGSDRTVLPLPHYCWSRVHGHASAGLLVESQLWGVLFVVLPRQLVGSGVSPYFACCPTSSVLKRSSFGISASGFALSLRDEVTLPGRVCLSPRSDRRLLLHLPGVWFESSRWGHPVGLWFVPDLDRNEDLLAHLPLWLVSCLRNGVPIFGRVALFCALDRNEGFFHSSILGCFAMGSPWGSSVCFPHSIVKKLSLVSCLVFLQDEVTLTGLDL